MRFLLTNDDGIYAEGLCALFRELSQDAECLIVAPETEQSAVGHAITLSRPLMVRAVKREGRFYGYAVAGTPADCVKLGIRELAGGPVDLVVSGINRGANVGTNLIYSGTVSAATEGSILGVSALAVSLDSRSSDADFSFAARFARKLASFMILHKFNHEITLNVNIPDLPEDRIAGVAVTRQGSARLVEAFERRTDPRNNTYFWLAGETFVAEGEHAESDATALSRGMVSITPIQYDLTRDNVIDFVKSRVGKLL